MKEEFFVSELSNGMTLLGQRMEHVSSAALTISVGAGASYDAPGLEGAAAVVTEWCFRGAGGRDTRQLNDALDALGCNHLQSVSAEHIIFSVAQLGRNLQEVLAIYADVLRRPRLEEATFESSRQLTLQDLASLEDEPARKCNILLREKFYPKPLGNCAYGRAESLQALMPDAVRGHADRRFAPSETILAVAGSVDWPRFRKLAEGHLGDWKATPRTERTTGSAAGGVTHVQKDSAQTHIGLAHRTVTVDSPQYYSARIAEAVLSAGMSSRLFTEVREKRGLVYHVSCRYHSLKDFAGMFTYAGTTPQKARETFDVTVRELQRLAEGIQPEEMARARTQLKSSLVMQGESTEARSASLASDWYHLRRLRSLQELSDRIDAVTMDDVMAHLAQHPAAGFTVLTIGPEALNAGAISK